ncbi:MAG: HesA/MoeB/ThiF family protein [Coriobacteriales bacterium]
MSLPARYQRNCEALSREECELLASKRVAVVGAGGLGGSVIEALARIGVGQLRVIDGDVFEESNLNRQLLATPATLGRPKAVCAAERVLQVNPLVRVEAVVEYLDESSAARLLEGADCVLDCLDNLGARFWLARAAGQLGLPVVYGAIAGWFGQVCTVLPGDVSFASVYGACEGTSQHKKLGNLPFTAYMVAAQQAAECVKLLTGRGELLRNRLLMFDLLDGSAEEMPLL